MEVKLNLDETGSGYGSGLNVTTTDHLNYNQSSILNFEHIDSHTHTGATIEHNTNAADSLLVCINCSEPFPSLFNSSEKEEFIILCPSPASSSSPLSMNEQDFVQFTTEEKSADRKSAQKYEINKVLASIYQLHYLDAFLQDGHPDPEIMSMPSNKNLSLCSKCAQILTNLYKYFTEFNQLRKIDSFLAKKIHRLDRILRNLLQNRSPSDRDGPRPRPRNPRQSQRETKNEVTTTITTVPEVKLEVEEEVDCKPEPEPEACYADISFDDMEDPDGDFINIGVDVDICSDPEGSESDKEFNFEQTTLTNNSNKPSFKSEDVIPNSGPWVRLHRLRNVRVGSPVRVSHQNQNTSNSVANSSNNEFQKLLKETGRKSRKTNQAASACIYIDSSEFSENENDKDNNSANDSDFKFDQESRPSRRKRTVTRRTFVTRTTTKTKAIPDINLVDETSSQSSSSGGSEDEDEDASSKSVKRLAKTKTTATTTQVIKRRRVRKSKSETNHGGGSRKQRNKEEKRVRDRLDKGYRRRKARVPNPCWHCPLDFPTQEECSAHTQATHLDLQAGHIFCTKCSRVCISKNSFSQHQKICESLRPGEKLAPFLCPHCGKKFPFNSYLKSHMAVHNEEGSFACSKCDFKAKSTLLINLHFNRMHVDHPKFEYKLGEDGKLSVAEPIVYKCDHCEATFKNNHSRKIHMVKLHTVEGNKRYREQQRALLDRQKEERRKRISKITYVCPECNIDFFSNLRLIAHRKTMHNVEKKFVCDQCGKDFSRAASLRYHMTYSHTDIRPFVCEHCGKAFKTVYNLKDHVNHTHSEEGRAKYNEFMRRHNQRRKIVAEALAKKIENGNGKERTAENSEYDPATSAAATGIQNQNNNSGNFEGFSGMSNEATVASSASSDSLFSEAGPGLGSGPGPSRGSLNRLMDSWNPNGQSTSMATRSRGGFDTTASIVANAAVNTARMLDMMFPQNQ